MGDFKPTTEGPPERWFSFLGLIVVRKTDLLAITAFVLSITTVMYQFIGFMRGARLTLYHPDTVYVYFDLYANGATVTRFAGELSVINSGDEGQNGILREVSAVISVGKLKFRESWLSFVAISRRGTVLSVDVKESAHPLLVSGGASIGQMTTFAPIERDCSIITESKCDESGDYISSAEFLRNLAVGSKISIVFGGVQFNSSTSLVSSCKISVTMDLISKLAENRWYAARCITDDAD